MKNSLLIEINGTQKTVIAEIIDKKLWFKIDEQIYSADMSDLAGGNYKKTKNFSKTPDKILAPMPGKITKIFVNEKQKVSKGDALIVMEAMKMEYTLKAEISAHVEAVFPKLGDQVTLGCLLIQLTENK